MHQFLSQYHEHKFFISKYHSWWGRILSLSNTKWSKLGIVSNVVELFAYKTKCNFPPNVKYIINKISILSTAEKNISITQKEITTRWVMTHFIYWPFNANLIVISKCLMVLGSHLSWSYGNYTWWPKMCSKSIHARKSTMTSICFKPFWT